MTDLIRKLLANSMLATGLLALGTIGTVSLATAVPATAMESNVVSRWDTALQGYVKPVDSQGVARFDYAGLTANQADRKLLKDYIAHLETKNPDTMSENEALAYWANLYNAVTVDVIVNNYPVTSIRKIRSGFSIGPWDRDFVTVNGTVMSLNDIEHGTMRKKFPSPLIHYMVNCASVGCPNLKDGLWQASTLDADREAAAKAFVNSDRAVRITNKGLQVSSIFKWYQSDFGGNKDGVLAHIRQYARPELVKAIDAGAKIRGFEYDWDLNE
ncbi:MAG: DUF547 domain-containing protein [Maricaulaceae bacterium]